MRLQDTRVDEDNNMKKQRIKKKKKEDVLLEYLIDNNVKAIHLLDSIWMYYFYHNIKIITKNIKELQNGRGNKHILKKNLQALRININDAYDYFQGILTNVVKIYNKKKNEYISYMIKVLDKRKGYSPHAYIYDENNDIIDLMKDPFGQEDYVNSVIDRFYTFENNKNKENNEKRNRNEKLHGNLEIIRICISNIFKILGDLGRYKFYFLRENKKRNEIKSCINYYKALNYYKYSGHLFNQLTLLYIEGNPIKCLFFYFLSLISVNPAPNRDTVVMFMKSILNERKKSLVKWLEGLRNTSSESTPRVAKCDKSGKDSASEMEHEKSKRSCHSRDSQNNHSRNEIKSYHEENTVSSESRVSKHGMVSTNNLGTSSCKLGRGIFFIKNISGNMLSKRNCSDNRAEDFYRRDYKYDYVKMQMGRDSAGGKKELISKNGIRSSRGKYGYERRKNEEEKVENEANETNEVEVEAERDVEREFKEAILNFYMSYFKIIKLLFSKIDMNKFEKKKNKFIYYTNRYVKLQYYSRKEDKLMLKNIIFIIFTLLSLVVYVIVNQYENGRNKAGYFFYGNVNINKYVYKSEQIYFTFLLIYEILLSCKYFYNNFYSSYLSVFIYTLYWFRNEQNVQDVHMSNFNEEYNKEKQSLIKQYYEDYRRQTVYVCSNNVKNGSEQSIRKEGRTNSKRERFLMKKKKNYNNYSSSAGNGSSNNKVMEENEDPKFVCNNDIVKNIKDLLCSIRLRKDVQVDNSLLQYTLKEDFHIYPFLSSLKFDKLKTDEGKAINERDDKVNVHLFTNIVLASDEKLDIQDSSEETGRSKSEVYFEKKMYQSNKQAANFEDSNEEDVVLLKNPLFVKAYNSSMNDKITNNKDDSCNSLNCYNDLYEMSIMNCNNLNISELNNMNEDFVKIDNGFNNSFEQNNEDDTSARKYKRNDSFSSHSTEKEHTKREESIVAMKNIENREHIEEMEERVRVMRFKSLIQSRENEEGDENHQFYNFFRKYFNFRCTEEKIDQNNPPNGGDAPFLNSAKQLHGYKPTKDSNVPRGNQEEKCQIKCPIIPTFTHAESTIESGNSCTDSGNDLIMHSSEVPQAIDVTNVVGLDYVLKNSTPDCTSLIGGEICKNEMVSCTINRSDIDVGVDGVDVADLDAAADDIKTESTTRNHRNQVRYRNARNFMYEKEVHSEMHADVMEYEKDYFDYDMLENLNQIRSSAFSSTCDGIIETDQKCKHVLREKYNLSNDITKENFESSFKKCSYDELDDSYSKKMTKSKERISRIDNIPDYVVRMDVHMVREDDLVELQMREDNLVELQMREDNLVELQMSKVQVSDSQMDDINSMGPTRGSSRSSRYSNPLLNRMNNATNAYHKLIEHTSLYNEKSHKTVSCSEKSEEYINSILKKIIIIDGKNIGTRYQDNYIRYFDIFRIKVVLDYYKFKEYDVKIVIPEEYIIQGKNINTEENTNRLYYHLHLKNNRQYTEFILTKNDLLFFHHLHILGCLIIQPLENYYSFCIDLVQKWNSCFVTNVTIAELNTKVHEHVHHPLKNIAAHFISYTFLGDEFLPNPTFRWPAVCKYKVR
ncbi:hypothetical protein, conserved [Plasmodium gonderi]|uniref:Tetratricopeptide repeat protein n=1 Tax=Plasmodium gonderi TaxID=77519 RepID=A0A1Y1JF99_PLAGO|nr:hypothetical protein, conserved [Plasmodium gonderi]GAW80328.1 hypothetical protein, conserved [Plasmodium gonderi]